MIDIIRWFKQLKFNSFRGVNKGVICVNVACSSDITDLFLLVHSILYVVEIGQHREEGLSVEVNLFLAPPGG